jgi:hypothetical protein
VGQEFPEVKTNRHTLKTGYVVLSRSVGQEIPEVETNRHTLKVALVFCPTRSDKQSRK